MIDVNKLKGKMKEKNITQAKLSDELNINISTLNRKLCNNGSGFTIEEADIIVNVLDMNSETATEIFFSQFVA